MVLERAIDRSVRRDRFRYDLHLVAASKKETLPRVGVGARLMDVEERVAAARHARRITRGR